MNARKTIIATAAAALAGSFLPWISFLWVTIYGVETDWGKLSAGAAALGIVLMFLGDLPWQAQLLPSLTVVGSAGYVFLEAPTAALGMGVYLTLIAGIAWTVAVVVTRRRGVVDVESSVR